jgi:dihydrofolate reductase
MGYFLSPSGLKERVKTTGLEAIKSALMAKRPPASIAADPVELDAPAVRRGAILEQVAASPAAQRHAAARTALTVNRTPIYNRRMSRKVILGFGISLDGYIARRNGDLDFLVIDKEGEALMADFFSKVDTTIMGRKTAAGWLKMRASGEIPDTPGMANYVVSRRWKPGKRVGFEVVSGPLTAFVKKLKRRSGKDIYLGGGGGLARSFLREDLVDELFIGLGPVLLGDGIPGFPGKFPQRDFKLTECKSYSNGSVGLRYERIRAKTSR